MSKASRWAQCQPKDIQLRSMEGHYTAIFLVTDEGKPGMRIDNSGPFNRRESLRLARWILDTFGETP